MVKKLKNNGNWDSISLIDENGSFRGEAKFSSKQEAQKYLLLYKKRLKLAGKAKSREKYQVFQLDNNAVSETNKRKYGASAAIVIARFHNNFDRKKSFSLLKKKWLFI